VRVSAVAAGAAAKADIRRRMARSREALVVFSPSGKRGRFAPGTSLLQAARKLGVDIDSICGGRARCGRCQVAPVKGEFAKENIVSDPAHIGPMSEDEAWCLKHGRLREGNRLSCQALIEGDLYIDVPASSQVHQQVVRKDYEARDIELDPLIRLYFVEVAEPDLDQPDGDAQRLLEALDEQWGLHGLDCSLDRVLQLQAALREGNWQVTVAVRDSLEIAAVWAGFRERVYGAAIDVGSTTIAVHLCDLSSGEVLASSGAMNPQIRFGEDLMSRVSYAMLNPDGATRMTRAVRRAIGEQIRSCVGQAGIDAGELLEIVLVGNPVMHHLLLGLDPAPLGVAPFALATNGAVEISAADLEFGEIPGARAWLPPCIAGHVGADTAAVLLAETPWLLEDISLIIDVGTNAEIVLGNRDRLLACSSPTGPAFEGAQISAGQRAAPGAIERVRIDPQTLEPRFRVIGSATWSDDTGFDEELGEHGVTGICGSGIIEVIAELFLAGLILPDGTIDGSASSRSRRIVADGRTFSYLLHDGAQRILVTQGDVRAVQLAKAALYAGTRLLMDRMEIGRVDRIRLAGAFGSHIDVKYAMVLGMIPDCPLEHVSSAGNAAGTGARVALLNRASRREIERRVRTIEKVETAVNPAFQQHFVGAMGIPHSSDDFPELARTVSLPGRNGGRKENESPRRRQARRGGRKA
jgi:uncharacterized 2Fe-2S/4Fe-4S cluster protein (DUF4445 family)